MANASRKPTLLMYPRSANVDNPYILHLVDVLSEKYEVINMSRFWQWGIFSILKCDIVHLNWIERIHGKTKFRQYIEYYLRVAFLYFLSISHKRVIWTVHNKVAHNAETEALSCALMSRTAALCSRIHILCHETENIPQIAQYRDKMVYIPHGDYFGDYLCRNLNIRQKHSIPEDAQILLFIGAIQPYKNIELLLRAFRRASFSRPTVLLMRGRCSPAYAEQLCAQTDIQHPSIRYDFTYCAPEDVGDYLKEAIACIAPYDTRSSLNSGTLWMAFSYQKTFICPKIGSVRDISNPDELGYFYDYSTPEEHEQALVEMLNRLGKDMENPESIVQKGKTCFEYMKQHSWTKNRIQWQELYR